MARWINLVSLRSHRGLSFLICFGLLITATACVPAHDEVGDANVQADQPEQPLQSGKSLESEKSLGRAHARIDRLYLDTAEVLSKHADGGKIDIRQLAGDIDAVSADSPASDPCLAQKRSQLMPILISLAVIDGMPDPAERRGLQAEAYRRLQALGDPTLQSLMGDVCFGQKFPNLAKIKK
jgi:hypothetical protein